MLLKSKICKMLPHSSEWFQARIGKLTGSRLGVFCAIKGLGDGAITYIKRKIAERLVGKSFEVPIDNFSTEWGRNNEPRALKEFQSWLERQLGKKIIMIRPSVIEYDELYSCTPDACVIVDEKLITDSNDTGYFVIPVEAKCLQIDGHMELLECESPADLKKSYSAYYWQMISQIQFTGALKGYFVAFHPELDGGLRIHVIEFRKAAMIEEFKLFNTRLEEARKLYNEKLVYYTNLKNKYNDRTAANSAA